jgi:ribose transport system permease protein
MSPTSPAGSLAAPPASRAEASALDMFRRSSLFFPLVGLVVVSALMAVAGDAFLSIENFTNILRQVSVIAIIAVGMTFVILSGGIDLSVGAVMALAGTVAAGLMASGIDPVLAFLAALLIGIAFGMLNGALIAYAGMPSIIVTLATMGIARGVSLIYSGGYPIDGLPEWISVFGSGSVAGLPVSGLMTAALYLLAWVLLARTAFGRHVYAIGGNETATRLSGIRVNRNKLAIYTISGVTSALAGIVMTSRLMSGQPGAGTGFELDAIAAVVLGGTAIIGGRGSVVGTLIGALLLGVLNNGLNMIGVDPYVQNIIKGVIILLAIYIGRERRA